MRKFLSTVFLLGLLVACAQRSELETGALQNQADTTAVFINELHYDNDGTDTGEAVEIAGPAGIDLTGWSLVLYNGSGGAAYNTNALSGTIPDEGNGFGTLAFSYPSNGIQNGSPDGLALVNGGAVVQFLSYEGVFTAVGGPADGLTSTDIGVSEGSSTPTDFSLQLTGSGATYQDFAWTGPGAASFGETNAGQSFSGTGNAPIVPDCTSPVLVTAGEPASRAVGATDADGTVTTVTLTAVEPATDGITLTGVTPATEEGGTATATLDVADTLTESGYSVTLTFANDDAEPQTADCTLVVTVAQKVKIHDVQGNGEASPLEGQTVSIEGIVVGDFQADDGDSFGTDLGGFYVQEEDVDADNDPATSEGIFVFAPDAADVKQGDLVTLTGEVDEYKGLTELTNISSLEVKGTQPLPSAAEITLPVASGDALERFESMYVVFSQPLVISEYFNFDRFGEIVLSLPVPEDQSRPYQPTSYLDPDTQAAAIDDAQARLELSRITLDDGRSAQNPDPARHPNGAVFDLNNRFRGGNVVQNATGVLDYRFGLYRVQPTEGADYLQKNPRPDAPDDVVGSLKVASFNVLNYFNGDGTGGGFPTSRGADDVEEFERQQAKIVSALSVIDADIVGLIEIENDASGERSALDDLVAALNAAVGSAAYAYIDTGAIGTDEIRVALIYKPATVTPLGDYAVLDASVDPRFVDTKNRPTLAQTFEGGDGGVFTVVVNHLKSKGSDCDDLNDPDSEDGQGNCNLTRERAAEALADWLATDPTGSGDPDILIVGDLNAYDEEDPIDALRAGSDDVLGTGDDFVDLEQRFGGEFAYSYLFDGQLGYLDYALASACLAPQVTGTTTWHINADEPDILDYDTTFKQDAQDALYEPNPYRSSDHDPVIVGLELYGGPASIFAYFVKELESLQADGALNGGQANALLKKLEGVQKSLDKGNLKTALNQLGTFENQLTDFAADGTLAAAQVERLLCLVQALRSALD